MASESPRWCWRVTKSSRSTEEPSRPPRRARVDLAAPGPESRRRSPRTIGHMTSPAELPAPRKGYFASSRAPRYSILFALPLLVLYEALAALLASPTGGVRNGADALFRGAFTAIAGSR